MSTLRRILLGVALAALAAACSGPPPKPCPRLAILGVAADETRFRDAGRDLTDIAFEIEVAGVNLICTHTEAGWLVNELTIGFKVERGPAGEGSPGIEYFVALIARDDQRVLDKKVFAVTLIVPEGQRRTQVFDEVLQEVKLPAGREGKDYTVFVGLQLSPDALAHNRRKRGEEP
ncbi:MAG: hypothetical protein FJX46_16405 [Alphaproteobacteria bacterium]|nr:hypothetical protein [Alphaproteobacteria bacterium]